MLPLEGINTGLTEWLNINFKHRLLCSEAIPHAWPLPHAASYLSNFPSCCDPVKGVFIWGQTNEATHLELSASKTMSSINLLSFINIKLLVFCYSNRKWIYSFLLAITEMQVTTTMRQYFTPTRLTKVWTSTKIRNVQTRYLLIYCWCRIQPQETWR